MRAAQTGSRGLPVEVEVETLDELDEALAAGAPRILLDNFSTYDIREAVDRSRGRRQVEISGGVTLERVPELGTTGAEFVSVGALIVAIAVGLPCGIGQTAEPTQAADLFHTEP